MSLKREWDISCIVTSFGWNWFFRSIHPIHDIRFDECRFVPRSLSNSDNNCSPEISIKTGGPVADFSSDIFMRSLYKCLLLELTEPFDSVAFIYFSYLVSLWFHSLSECLFIANLGTAFNNLVWTLPSCITDGADVFSETGSIINSNNLFIFKSWPYDLSVRSPGGSRNNDLWFRKGMLLCRRLSLSLQLIFWAFENDWLYSGKSDQKYVI